MSRVKQPIIGSDRSLCMWPAYSNRVPLELPKFMRINIYIMDKPKIGNTLMVEYRLSPKSLLVDILDNAYITKHSSTFVGHETDPRDQVEHLIGK